MLSEWKQLVEYSQEQRKPIWDRTVTAQESSDEWQRIIDAGISPFEKARRADTAKLSVAEQAQFSGP